MLPSALGSNFLSTEKGFFFRWGKELSKIGAEELVGTRNNFKFFYN
jgi:hypothetical protein